MPELLILGSAASVPDADHDTVALAVRGAGWAVPIDCAGSPLYKLARAGIELEDIRALVLTHAHADHLYGLPILAQGMWLAGREAPLPVYGPAQALAAARRLLDLFDLVRDSERFRAEWHAIPLREKWPVLEVAEPAGDRVRITASPVVHGTKETVALRFDDVATGGSLVYSSDTEPCDPLIRLAAGADWLVHEATGAYPAHASPAQAAEVARRAGASRLALIHYPVRHTDLAAWRREAAGFPGPVTLAQDGDRYPF